MVDTIFINLYKSLAEAKTVKQSPQVDMTISEYRGVQLLPNNEYPYSQITSNPTGIELGDWTVKLFTLCGKELSDISAYFFVKESFQDLDGMPQIRWTLTNVPFDAGARLVYMEVTQTVGETFWSNPFELTAIKQEKTTRFDYFNKFGRVQSVEIKMWFDDPGLVHNINQRVEESTNYSRSITTQLTDVEIMNADNLAISLMVKFVKMMGCDFVYKDLVRVSFYESVEIPRRAGATNSNGFEYILAPIPTETFDPLYEPPTPEPPEVGGDWSFTILGIKSKIFYEPNTRYAAKIMFNHYPEFDIVQNGFCTVEVNGSVLNFPQNNIVVLNGVVTMVSEYTYVELTPNQTTIGNFQTRTTNGFTSLRYFYDGAPQLFTQAQMENKVPRLVTGTIEAV